MTLSGVIIQRDLLDEGLVLTNGILALSACSLCSDLV